jgi:hypothetical protein
MSSFSSQGEETDTGFQLSKLCRFHGSDWYYYTVSSEDVLHSELEADQVVESPKALMRVQIRKQENRCLSKNGRYQIYAR